MMRLPLPSITTNTLDFETHPLVKPTGFREYDARWWFGLPTDEKPSELNLYGVRSLCLLYTSPSPRDLSTSRMPSSA